MKLLKRLKETFGLKKRTKHKVWVVILKRKAEFTGEKDVAESYFCGSPFGTEYEARRHKESLEKDSEFTGFSVIDIQPIETNAPITVAKYNYDITPEHPKISVTYEELE